MRDLMPSTISDRSSVSANISRSAVQILAEYTGRGPTTAHTVINRDVILILMGDTLTKGERSLAAMGMADHVLETRRNYQRAMKEELVGVVEEHSGRKVVAFLSENHIDPDLAAEVFVLEPDKAADADGANIFQKVTI
jgi:uncharacterized protein YbcI